MTQCDAACPLLVVTCYMKRPSYHVCQVSHILLSCKQTISNQCVFNKHAYMHSLHSRLPPRNPPPPLPRNLTPSSFPPPLPSLPSNTYPHKDPSPAFASPSRSRSPPSPHHHERPSSSSPSPSISQQFPVRPVPQLQRPIPAS